MLVVECGFGGADRLDKLGAGAGGTADDAPLGMAPVRRHLAAAGSRVIFGAHRLQKHFERRDAEHQAKGAVAVVREDPVDAGTKKQPHCGRYGFMAGAGDLEKDLVLTLQLDFTVVQAAGEKHRAVKSNEGIAVEAAKFDCAELCHFDASLYCHSGALVLKWGLIGPGKVNYTENSSGFANSGHTSSLGVCRSQPGWNPSGGHLFQGIELFYYIGKFRFVFAD